MLVRIPTYNELTQSTASSSTALVINSTAWKYPGSALTASSKSSYAQLGQFARIVYARVHVVWTANTTTSKVRLIKADAGPNNEESIGTWLSPQSLGDPITGSIVCTEDLQAIFDAEIEKYIAVNVVGQGILYRATLDIVWEIEIPDAVAPDLSSIETRLTAIETALADIQNGQSPEPGTPAQTITVPTEGLTLSFVPA